MSKYINVCAIVPNNFAHKAGDGTFWIIKKI